MGLHLLYIREHVHALLGVDARDSVEEIALQTQGDRRAGLDDGVARSRDVDALDGLAVDLAGGRSRTDGGHQPAMGVSYGVLLMDQRGLPNRGDAMLGAGENYDDCQWDVYDGGAIWMLTLVAVEHLAEADLTPSTRDILCGWCSLASRDTQDRELNKTDPGWSRLGRNALEDIRKMTKG